MSFGLGFWAAAGANGVPQSYELISSTILTSNSSGFNFTSIPQTYKHLQLRITMRLDQSAVAGDPAFDFHPVSGGTTYSQHYIQNSGLSVSSAGNANLGIINFTNTPAANATSGVFGACIMDILNYSSTTKNKTVRMLSGYAQDSTYSRIDLRSGAWYNTGALNDIRMRPYSASNFVAGSRFSLYGIRG